MSGYEGAEAPVVVGTAGHVDHGKSALVLALTGTDPDRLPQERERGITIDLGFASLPLPSGRRVGLVDVPGHEHYVRAMVAGATGVDVALLVVAGDDGVMPQTREHLRILDLVGAPRLVVAITKCDLVTDEDWLDLVESDVEEFVGATRFAGSPVVRVCARTGAGIPELGEALERAVEEVLGSGLVERRMRMPARLPVDRSFNVAGFGAVVTGTLRSGTVAPGDAVEVFPGGARAKVRGVQVRGEDVERAVAGQRTAVNLAGVELSDVARGCTVGAPSSLEAHDRFDAHVAWLGRDGSADPLSSGERVHVCTGTSEALGRVLLFDGEQELPCGGQAFVQIRLEEPLVVRAHDRFVLMAYSPVELVGGGEVLLSRVPRRSTPAASERELLAAQLAGDLPRAVDACLHVSRTPLRADEVARLVDEPTARVESALADLVADARAVELPCGQDGSCFSVPAVLDALVARIDAELSSEAEKDPRHEGMPALTLRDRVSPRCDEPVFAAVVDVAASRGVAGRFGSNVASAAVIERLRARIEGLVDKVSSALDARGVAVPFAEELAPDLGITADEALRGMRELADRGLAVRIEKNWYMGCGAYEAACDLVRRTIGQGGSATASELREALGLSRKYAMPLLEHLDRAGLTVRDAADPNLRRLR